MLGCLGIRSVVLFQVKLDWVVLGEYALVSVKLYYDGFDSLMLGCLRLG